MFRRTEEAGEGGGGGGERGEAEEGSGGGRKRKRKRGERVRPHSLMEIVGNLKHWTPPIAAMTKHDKREIRNRQVMNFASNLQP